MKIITSLVVIVVITIIGTTIWGIILGFHASLLVGVLHLIIPPLSFITGGIELITDTDISIQIAQIFTNLMN